MSLQIPGFQASIVLLLRIWLAKRAGIQVDVAKELKDVQVVIDFLAEGEAKCAASLLCCAARWLKVDRWPLSGRFKDLLITLSTVSEWPTQMTNMFGMKRGRPDEEDSSSQPVPQFPPSSGLARASAVRNHRTLSQTTTGGAPQLDGVSTFGPPLAHHESFSAPGTGAPFTSANCAPVADLSLSGMQHRHSNSQPVPTAGHTSSYIPNDEMQQYYGGSLQTSHNQIETDELYRMLGNTLEGLVPGDTPSPSSNSNPSPATHLGLTSDMYNSSLFGLDPIVDSSSMQDSYRGPAPFPGAPAPNPDELQQFFAPMVAHDGQLGVDSDLVSMWTSMPVAYQYAYILFVAFSHS